MIFRKSNLSPTLFIWGAIFSLMALLYPVHASAATDVSGMVNYSGNKRVYLTMQTPNGSMGTSISAPGAFTIRGVPAGTYMISAFMDLLGTGSRHASDPSGTTVLPVTVGTTPVSNVSINLTKPQQLTTVQPPTGLKVFPTDSAALVSWNQYDTGNGSQADSYSVYWDSGPNPVPGSTIGSRTNIPASGDKTDLLLNGLTNGTYYFVITATSGTVTSAPSAVFGPVTVGQPIGGYTVSGTVTFPTVANGKPLYLAIGDSAGKMYPAYYSSATNPQAYTVSGVPNGVYRVYAVLDVDNNGLIGIGDYKTHDTIAPTITVSNGLVSNINLTLGSENSVPNVITGHWKNGTTDSYLLNFEIYDGLKKPATVTLTSGPNLTGPIDFGLNSWGGFFSMISTGTTVPAVTDPPYYFDVTYTDNTTDTSLSCKVTGVVTDFAIPVSPIGSTSYSATPTFSWTEPASKPANGNYAIHLNETNGTIGSVYWDSSQIPFGQTAAVFNFDNRASQTALTNGKSYDWGVMVIDQQRNFSSSYSSFNFPGEVTLTPSLYNFGTVPVGGSATWPLTINNIASSPVSVYGISVSGADFSLDYTGGAAPCNSPYPLIAAGANCTLSVIIKPTSTGLKSATVTVTTNNPLAATLTANFSATAVNYTITAPATVVAGGFISPPGITTLALGGSMTYFITPNAGYHIAGVKVDGVSQGAITSYTFSNVTANHTIDATFAINSADISGTISYSGSKRVYITVQPNGPTQPNNGILGTSIAAPGPFTIRGVPDGSYTVNAFMDNLDLGTQVQTSPSGTTAATVAGSNLSGLSIMLSAPTPMAPPAPLNLTASPGNGSLLMDWDKQRNNGIESADAYDIYWGTAASVSKVSNSGSRLNVPAGFDSPVVIDGLNNGDKFYFIVIAKSGGVESTPSTAIGPFTIGTPAGGYTVSGTLNYSGPPATGPLYIAIVSPMTKGAAGIYYTKIAAPSASNIFTVTGVPNGDYVIYSIIDMNNDRLFGIGDVMTPDNQAPAIKVNGAALTGATVTLTGINGEAAITTDHNIPASGPAFFNIEGSVRGQLKRPVAVTLTAAPATFGIPLPMDLGLDGKNGSGNFHFWSGSSTRPTTDYTFTFTVTYADGTVDSTVTASVTGVSDSFPTNPLISAPVTTVPVFTWGAPTTPPPTYSYSVWVGAANSTNVWDAWDLPASINSIAYGATGSTAQPLLIGSSYYWHVSTRDPNGNRASIGSNFVPTNQGTPLIFWPTPAAVPLGTSLSAAELNATASVPGIFSYSPAAGTVLAAGAQTLTVNFTPTDITNYTSSSATVTLNVNPVITATASSGGSITPAGVTMVTNGGNQSYSITPTTGYHITDVKVDGVSQGAINTYSFSSVTANHTIVAAFAVDTFTITATANSGGTISPAGATPLNYGATQSYSITPKAGFVLIDVRVDQVSVGKVNSYTFNNVTAGHTIESVFGADGVIDPKNTSGVPQIGDALIVLTAALDPKTLDPTKLKNVDTAPMINGVPQPDGKVDLLDVLIMLRRVVGLEKW